MNTFVFGVITKRLEEKELNVHKVFNMSDKHQLFEELYHYVRYVKQCGAELTMVALDAAELEHYFECCYLERYAYKLNV